MTALVPLAIAAVVTMAAPPAVERPEAQAQPQVTRLEWSRSGAGEVVVTGTKGGARLAEATAELQAVADRLDALRTIRRHVRWTRLEWRDGVIAGAAWAEAGVFGNLALLAVRDLLPGRATAGSGVRQVRQPGGAHAWVVRILVGAARE